MSALGALLSRGIVAIGGPQTAVVVVVGGLVVGGIGGGAVAAGALGGHAGGPAATGNVPIYPCPNQGPALVTVAGGQQLLVTGRLADGSWLRIHLPEPGRSEGWIQASPVTVSGSIDSLPVAECGAEAVIPAPAVIAALPMTAIVNATPTPVPTAAPTPSPTVAPTASPTATPNATPKVASLTVSTRTISYDTGAYCPNAPKTATFTVQASDTSGIAGVVLFWRGPARSAFAQAPMTQASGTAVSGTWQVTLDTTANAITKAGSLAFYAIATDTSGATGRLPAGSYSINVAVCLNTGPAITSVASSGGSPMYSDPFGLGCTPTTTNITAAVNDPDGVKSVTLFFRRPGSSTWSSKLMDNTIVPPRWYANLDTLGDKIPVGTLSWYIKAVDGKNVASQSKTASVAINLCKDQTPPVVSTPKPSPSTIRDTGDPACTAHISTSTITVTAIDPETGISSVTLWYRLASGGTAHSKAMTPFVGGPAGGYSTTLDAFALGLGVGSYDVWVVAVNGTGGSAQSSNNVIMVVTC